MAAIRTSYDLHHTHLRSSPVARRAAGAMLRATAPPLRLAPRSDAPIRAARHAPPHAQRTACRARAQLPLRVIHTPLLASLPSLRRPVQRRLVAAHASSALVRTAPRSARQDTLIFDADELAVLLIACVVFLDRRVSETAPLLFESA